MMALAALQVCVLVGLLCLSLSWAQAPGDEDRRCTVDHTSPATYPDTQTNLMDSYNYQDLLPGNGTGNTPIATAVWNDYSFDGNDDPSNIISQTYWQQGAGGICRFQSKVCGWRKEGTKQKNWLFTQHIRQDFDSNTYNYNVSIHVWITYSVQSCRERLGCRQGFDLLHYMTNSAQLPSLNESGFMNTINYHKFAEPYAATSLVTYTNTYTFTLPPSSTGFYIAAQDTGSCATISRLRVYRNNCKSRQLGLVLYPDAPAPVSNSRNIDVSCVENAVVSGSAVATCASDGTWGPERPVCQCQLGHEQSSATQCSACPAGQYRSSGDTTCQECPANTVMTQEAAPECRCLNEHFRNNESNPETRQCENPTDETSDYDCTKPPSTPEGLSVVAVSAREIMASWSPPAEDGGRTDLYYWVEHSDPDNLGSYINGAYLCGEFGNRTFSGLSPFTPYCVRVTAHNGVSDQDPDGTHLRTVEACTVTPEDEPGLVGGVKGHCSVVVWDVPTEPNGVITNYTLLFLLNQGNDSGLVVETDSDVTHFEIRSPLQLPRTPASGSAFVKIRAQNGAGKGNYSPSAYIGCEDPPGTCTNESSPFFPPTLPEPLAGVVREGELLYWGRPPGRVSYYLVTVSSESGEKLVEQQRTNEQFITLPTESPGKISVEVCTELDGVQGNCTQYQLPATEADKTCTEEDGGDGEMSQLMIIALCAGCGGTALLVGTCCLLAAALHHWRFRKQFGPNKEALTWEAYELKT